MRPALLAALLICLAAVAAPAQAHDLAGDHSDWRGELAFTDVAGTVETVDRAAGTEGEGLPLSWCGAERTSDDVIHARNAPALPQLKLVYAYASDRTNRFASWKDALQADVSLISRFMGAQSGGRKAPRFDMGTDCGPDYVDIQVVALPGGRATYANNLSALKTAVGAQVPAVLGQPRNTLVLADRMSSSPAGYWSGIGESYISESPGSASPHNMGGLFSALWVPDAEPAPGPDPDGWWAEGLLHELSHNLGAVGDGAPHSSGFGHCFDGYDVMCYHDDDAAPPMTYPCAEIAGVMSQVYDCGGDDYFNVAPAAGTYLAGHWNLYDNRFLAACADAAPACGGTAVIGTNPQPPVSTAAPSVAGEARVGSLLTATTGAWTNAPASFAYQWEQGDGTTWLAVPGAVGAAHPVTEDDAGLRLRVRVIAVNGDGATAAYSLPTATVGEPAATASSTPPATPGSGAPSRGRAALRIARGKGRGKRLGTIAFEVAGSRLRSSATRVRLARGRYQLRLCTTAGGAPRCTRRALKVARASAARLPSLSLAVPAGATGRVSYMVRAVRGVFSALTAKRPAAGLLLGP